MYEDKQSNNKSSYNHNLNQSYQMTHTYAAVLTQSLEIKSSNQCIYKRLTNYGLCVFLCFLKSTLIRLLT